MGSCNLPSRVTSVIIPKLWPEGTRYAVYTIERGELRLSPQLVFPGYAGKGMWRDDPGSCDQRGLGPLPCGQYRVAKPVHHPRLGPIALRLDPLPGTEMFGRSGMYIHGDNAKGDKSASSGCIVVNRIARQAVASAVGVGPYFLWVIPR